MNHQGNLSEEDFKVEGHCCAVTFPAIKTLEDGIDFQADEEVQAYMAEHYKMAITPPKPTTRKAGTLKHAITIIDKDWDKPSDEIAGNTL